jgi:RHS repeat-associated protein
MEQEHDRHKSQYHTLSRQYDAVLGRWWSIDPEQERYASFSPYTAMGANPVNRIDPDGNFEFAKVGEVSKGGRSQSFKQEFDIIADGKHLVPIVKNIKNYVKTNSRILDALVKFTGHTSDKILKDLEYGQGPKLFVVKIVQDGFEVDGDILIAKRLHNNP